MAPRSPHPPDPGRRAKRGLTPFGAAVAVLVALAAACAGGGGGAPPPSTPATHAAVGHHDRFAGAGRAALRYLRRIESRYRPARLRVQLSTLERRGASRTVLATVSARLGRRPGTIWVGLGQRVLVMRARAGRVRVAADDTGRGGVAVAHDGLAAMPRRSLIVRGDRIVVVAAPGVSPADANEVVSVADGTLPGLLARYRLHDAPAPLPPVVFLTRSWALAQRVAGQPMPREAIGAEYLGLVFVDVPAWERLGTLARDALVVHELTHVASARLTAGVPLSLIEGLARYEEQQYVAARGGAWPFRYLARAYARGYPSLDRWRWTFGRWLLHRPFTIWLAYEDGAAIVRAVVHDGGDAALRRLGQAFRRDDVAGRFSPRQVDRAFRAAVGRPFAQVVAEAHAETAAAAGE
jgi:hypothetical protein